MIWNSWQVHLPNSMKTIAISCKRNQKQCGQRQEEVQGLEPEQQEIKDSLVRGQEVYELRKGVTHPIMLNGNGKEVTDEKGACRSYELSLHNNKNIKAQNQDSDEDPQKNYKTDWGTKVRTTSKYKLKLQ